MGLREDIENVTVSQLNIRPPLTVPDTATVRDAVVAMRDAGLGCAIVVDEERKAVGIFSEGMLRHALNESAAVLDEPLVSQMATRLPWVSPTEEIAVVLEAMEEFNMRYIAVLNEQHHVLGITGHLTLMEYISERFPQQVLTQDPTGNYTPLNKEGA